MIFSYFDVPLLYQHKVLFWGILGALVMRAIFIVMGITLIQKVHWVIYIFGGFLILTGVKVALQKEKEIRPERNPVLRIFKRFVPVSDHYEDGKFFIKKEGRYLSTPLFVVLLVVETTDIVFAMDSIPAILAITLDPFIVYASNVFAILGLRALYFSLAGMMRLFQYLHYGLSAILACGYQDAGCFRLENTDRHCSGSGSRHPANLRDSFRHSTENKIRIIDRMHASL